MPDQNKTEIVILLDRSGSMADMKHDMEKGFDAFRDTQLKVPGTCVFTLVQFDSVGIDTVYEAQLVQHVPKLVLDPRGATPLLDAMGDTVTKVGERLSRRPEHERPGKVIFVVLTDGEENSSVRWTKDRVQALVNDQRDKYAWQFMYLGADVKDWHAQSASVGTYTANAAFYDKAHTATAMNLVGEKISTYRTSNDASTLIYSDEDRTRLTTDKK